MYRILVVLFAALSAFGQQATAQPPVPNPTDKQSARQYLENDLTGVATDKTATARREFDQAVEFISKSDRRDDWRAAAGHLRRSISAVPTKTAYLWLVLSLDLINELDEAKAMAQAALRLPDAGDKEMSARVTRGIRILQSLVDQQLSPRKSR